MGNQTEENWQQLWELVFSQNESVQTVLLGGSDEFLGRGSNNQNGNLRWCLLLGGRPSQGGVYSSQKLIFL